MGRGEKETEEEEESGGSEKGKIGFSKTLKDRMDPPLKFSLFVKTLKTRTQK
jgi:hypothetical protein